ncbi:MAG: beta-N-acetylhexosaminidase [Alkalispirochaeta sp.]
MSIWNRIIPRPKIVHDAEGTCLLPAVLTVAPPSGARGFDDTTEYRKRIERINAAAMRILSRSIPLFALADEREQATITIDYRTDLTQAYRITVESEGITIEVRENGDIAPALAVIVQGLLLASSDAVGRDGRAGGTDDDAPTHPGSRRRAGDGAAGRETAAAITTPHLTLGAVIEDASETEWRGFMLDVARHFAPVESLDRIVDLLWLFRLNRFHLHLTDDQGWRFVVPGYPRLTEIGAWRPAGTSDNQIAGGFYSPDELRTLDEGCRLLGITVVPEVDLPGHASAAFAAYPELSCTGGTWHVETRWGIFPSVLCASDEGVAPFLDAVFASIADTFSGPYIHIGGDEVPPEPWTTCPRCRELSDPYQAIVRRIADTVVSLGRRPVVWDEASALDLPPGTIVVNWRGPEGARNALAGGYDLVLAPEQRSAYLDHKHLDSPLEPGRIGVCTVADAAGFAPTHYAETRGVPVGVDRGGSVPGGISDRGRSVPGGIDGNAASGDSGPSGPTGTGGAGAGPPSPGTILGGQGNLWTEGVHYHREIEYMAIVRLAAIAEGLWSGRPAADSTRFFEDLDTLRRCLSDNGYNVYPGTFR